MPALRPDHRNVKYRLIVLTHGGDENTEMLLDTLASFEEMVTPKPTESVLIEDGPRKQEMEWEGTRIWTDEPLGFCKTAMRGWEVAGAPGVDWVYWLEHDFRHRRPVDLVEIATVLMIRSEVAQISLMRQPVNREEVKAGGVVALAPHDFIPKIIVGLPPRRRRLSWLEQGRYWTTNPSLFTQEIAAEFPWPEGEGCEGRHTIGLREAGYSFGVWGAGEAWVEHVGERSGFGY